MCSNIYIKSYNINHESSCILYSTSVGPYAHDKYISSAFLKTIINILITGNVSVGEFGDGYKMLWNKEIHESVVILGVRN